MSAPDADTKGKIRILQMLAAVLWGLLVGVTMFAVMTGVQRFFMSVSCIVLGGSLVWNAWAMRHWTDKEN